MKRPPWPPRWFWIVFVVFYAANRIASFSAGERSANFLSSIALTLAGT